MFSTKRKKSNQNQNHKNRKEFHEHCTNFHCLHCCIQSLHLLHFKMKVACICIPKKIMFILGNKCIDERSSKGVNILFSHKAKDLLAHFIGLKVLTFILS